MSTDTKIEWATKSWSPIIGCTRVSPGCDNCYAIRTARRLAANPNPKIADSAGGTVHRSDDDRLDWTGKVNLLHRRAQVPCGPCTGAHAAAERRRAQARKDRAA